MKRIRLPKYLPSHQSHYRIGSSNNLDSHPEYSAIPKSRGFALVSTITIMGLLLMLCLAMFSLSSIETKSISTNTAMNQARANARMAAMIALGELQQSTGSDMRVTAPANILEGNGGGSNHVKQLYGVWHSWKGRNHSSEDDSVMLPIAPDYTIKKQMFSSDSSDSGSFERWLVSGDVNNLTDPLAPPSLLETDTTVPLLAEGTLPGVDGHVHLEPTEIDLNGERGAIAWTVQGLNTKVRINPTEEAQGVFESIDQLSISPGPSSDEFGLQDNSKMDQVVSHETLTIVNGPADSNASTGTNPSDFFHDLTTSSTGLLTNTANGGWKRDLSFFSENFNRVNNGFPAYTITPGVPHTSDKTVSSGGAASLYPWVTWPSNGLFPQSITWNGLINYGNQFQLSTSGGGDLVARFDATTSGDRLSWSEEVRRVPLMTRFHWVISLSAVESTTSTGTTEYTPALTVNPVVTLWNPYDIEIDVLPMIDAINGDSFQYSVREGGCPLTFQFKLNDNGTETDKTLDFGQLITRGNGATPQTRVHVPIQSPNNVWKPGEVRQYSPASVTPSNGGDEIFTIPGYRPGGGLRYTLPDVGSFPGTTEFSIADAQMTADFVGPNVIGIGFYFVWGLPTKNGINLRNVQSVIDEEHAAEAWGNRVDGITGITGTLESIARDQAADGGGDIPVLSVVNSLRFARDVNPLRGNIVGNGIHHMSSFSGFLTNGNDVTDDTILRGRNDHFPYNILFYPLNGSMSGEGLPSGFADEEIGYLGGGFGDQFGLNNLIIKEIPKRSLISIGDLTHLTPNASSAFGPYNTNAFLNSRANAFIESDAIRIPGSSGEAANDVGNDNSFAMNHLFADDWCVSSIGTQNEQTMLTGSENKSQEEVLADFLSGVQDIPNHYYKAAKTRNVQQAEDLANDLVNDSEGWNKIAAEIEVQGMFNVNSTSELAWEMLLKRNFGADENKIGVPIYDGVSDVELDIDIVSTLSGTPFPRTTMHSNSIINAGGEEASKEVLSLPMRFNDEEIKELAREIVVEVKKRGPFLSLSEFYNRQLSDDEDLAHAGAVEAALLSMSERTGSSAINPYSDILSLFPDEASTVGPWQYDAEGNQTERFDVLAGNPQKGIAPIPFPKAAEGNPAYGFPGWARQADVLRSISSILNVRDDSFIIRAYGSSKDESGNIIAEAWCELTVARTPEFVKRGNLYELPTDETHPFGRKYVVRQFRWLNRNDV